VREERVLSLIAAAGLWSGITSNAGLLGSPCVVLRAVEPIAPVAEAIGR
jgi:hypothetical protein